MLTKEKFVLEEEEQIGKMLSDVCQHLFQSTFSLHSNIKQSVLYAEETYRIERCTWYPLRLSWFTTILWSTLLQTDQPWALGHPRATSSTTWWEIDTLNPLFCERSVSCLFWVKQCHTWYGFGFIVHRVSARTTIDNFLVHLFSEFTPYTILLLITRLIRIKKSKSIGWTVWTTGLYHRFPILLYCLPLGRLNQIQ